MKENTYLTIQGWMVNCLQLKGNELIVYAIIYGFSQDGKSVYSGTSNYLSGWTNTSRECVSRTLKSLVEKGLIIKISKVVNGVELYDYKVNFEYLEQCDIISQGVIKNHRGCDKLSQGGCDKKSHHNNIIDNNIDNKENYIKENPNYPIDKEVCDKWNSIAEKFKLPKISKMTDERRLRLAKVLKENELTIEQFFNILEEKLHKSLFLQGLKQVKDGGDWRFECADWQSNFDFYLEKGKMLKVMEDAYTDKMFLK